MKICLHTNWEISKGFIGGTERFLVDLSKELQLIGHEPFIVCSNKEEETYIEGIKVIGRFIELDKSSGNYPYFSSTYIKNEIIGDKYSIDSLKRLSLYTEKQLEGIEADVYHLNSFISASYINPNRNYVITNHENNQEYDWYWGDGFYDFFRNLVYERKTNLHLIETLYTPSDYYADFFSKGFNLKVKSINLGISLNNFIIESKEESLKEEYGFSKDDKIILLPSRFQPHQKGHDVAIKACAILKQKGISFKIIFTGVKKSSEKYRSGFDDLVFKYDLQNNIKVVTFPKIQEAYRNADVVISPERFCSYGLSISESLSLGIPTILSDISTYKEIAKQYKHAFFFKLDSEVELAELLTSVLNNSSRNRNEAIRFRIRYDLRKCCIKYSEIYDNLN